MNATNASSNLIATATELSAGIQLDMNGFRIVGVSDALGSTDAVNLQTADARFY